MPVAFCRQSRIGRGNSTEWSVTLRATDFLALVALVRVTQPIVPADATGFDFTNQ